MRKKIVKNLPSVLLAAAITVSGMFSVGTTMNVYAGEINPYGLHTPTERDTDSDGTKEMTWDCITFGVYPQSEESSRVTVDSS